MICTLQRTQRAGNGIDPRIYLGPTPYAPTPCAPYSTPPHPAPYTLRLTPYTLRLTPYALAKMIGVMKKAVVATPLAFRGNYQDLCSWIIIPKNTSARLHKIAQRGIAAQYWLSLFKIRDQKFL
jgi:hypothetical protein